LEIFPLLLSFMLFKDLEWILVLVGLLIGVSDSDVDDAVRTVGPKAPNEQVSSFFTSCLAQVFLDGCGVVAFVGILCFVVAT
jgi:hypothetical protein